MLIKEHHYFRHGYNNNTNDIGNGDNDFNGKDKAVVEVVMIIMMIIKLKCYYL